MCVVFLLFSWFLHVQTQQQPGRSVLASYVYVCDSLLLIQLLLASFVLLCVVKENRIGRQIAVNRLHHGRVIDLDTISIICCGQQQKHQRARRTQTTEWWGHAPLIWLHSSCDSGLQEKKRTQRERKRALQHTTDLTEMSTIIEWWCKTLEHYSSTGWLWSIGFFGLLERKKRNSNRGWWENNDRSNHRQTFF